MVLPGLPAIASYLRGTGWELEDTDSRTTLWRPAATPGELQLEVVLPARESVADWQERAWSALRTLAYAEHRLPEEIAEDINFGGADNVAVRMTPDAPEGQAPLSLAASAVHALQDYVTGSASALEIRDLVLPSHRPQWAEIYAGRTRLAMRAGSFVLSLALPLAADVEPSEQNATEEDTLFRLPPQPFGRRVSNRMLVAARAAQQLAELVSAGDRPLRAFGEVGVNRVAAANATELAALRALGGPEMGLYRLRFAQSPLARNRTEPVILEVTPGQQRILGEAADFLRAKQPRTGVTVRGLVVRLYRQHSYGAGVIWVEGVDDDSGTRRRYRVELAESDYNDAYRAHGVGLEVSVTGDREEHGNYLYLRRITSFSVVPGLDDALHLPPDTSY